MGTQQNGSGNGQCVRGPKIIPADQLNQLHNTFVLFVCVFLLHVYILK